MCFLPVAFAIYSNEVIATFFPFLGPRLIFMSRLFVYHLNNFHHCLFTSWDFRDEGALKLVFDTKTKKNINIFV